MKRAVSVSIGSSKRDKAVEVELLGEQIRIERIGTDGDMEKAAHLYQELDGQVDAFGVGGADLGALVDGKFYPFHSVQPMVRFIEKTPVVDGGGLKNTLENKAPAFLDEKLGEYLAEKGRKVFVALGVDRWGLSKSFVEAGYEVVFGDLMFALDVPLAIKSLDGLRLLAKLMIPIVTRFPFEWLYPTGEKQDERVPKYEKYYQWATVIAGDCHYVKSHMPDDMTGKVIVTNTTTPADVELFKSLGVKYLITTTPVLDGRSFGTNMMEAALVAVSGKNRPLTWEEYDEILEKLGFEPQIQELN
ncbi:MAG: quinate 5-dehydrogenase [Anaerolineae bacterium]|nr:quinate 5-dehydrogenase [Anaerolineae bacterium]MBL6966201.1 quinate 5-dehydrogenase [Anaerolineales bacterium]